MKPYYQHGGVTIYHGDCREVLPVIVPEPIAVVTDPPYSISLSGVSHDRTAIGKGTRVLDFFAGDSDWKATTEMVLEGIRAATELCATAYVWCGHRQFGALVDDFEARGWKTRFLVWAKECPVPAPPGVGWNSGAELCVYAFRDGRKWTHATGDGPVSNVLWSDSYRHGQPGKVAHPTQKPFGVILPLIEAGTEPGDLVLDPFMGSGTTLVAAKDNARRAIGIEIEERYCEIAAKRLSQEVLFAAEPTA